MREAGPTAPVYDMTFSRGSYKISLFTVALLALIAASSLQYYFWVVALAKWFGSFGAILGALFVPSVVLFPFFHWVIEDEFPNLYFALLLAQLLLFLMSWDPFGSRFSGDDTPEDKSTPVDAKDLAS